MLVTVLYYAFFDEFYIKLSHHMILPTVVSAAAIEGFRLPQLLFVMPYAILEYLLMNFESLHSNWLLAFSLIASYYALNFGEGDYS